MSFVYPLGLLGLIGIPILIFIYIIKTRYTEQIIPSTYIWHLSEKFLRRRVPISRLAGILSLILQILVVVFLSVAMAHPVFTIPHSARAYCFVLDGSGSMNFVQDGETRFEIAKEAIIDIIDDSMNGSEYTLIFAGSTTETMFENVTDKKSAKQIVRELESDYVATEAVDARVIAQRFFDENPSTDIYLVTDKDYDFYYNVTVIDVSDATENYALTDIKYGLSGAQLVISGTAISYASEAKLRIELYLYSGSEEKPYSDTKEVTADPNGTRFEFECKNITGFESFRVRIAQTDDLLLDNEVTIYDVKYENITDVLVVSDSPIFIRAALTAVGVGNIEILSTKEYTNLRGYGLYIFDTFTPKEMPDDGAVWFFNPQASVPGSNFSYQAQIDSPKSSAVFSDSTNTLVRKLLESTSGDSFQIKKYVRCGINADFKTLISLDGNPLLFVGKNVYGYSEAVFAFDVHDSAQVGLMGDFTILVSNLINYSFPSVVDSTFYYSGDTMLVSVIPGCNNIRIETPSGKAIYLDPTAVECSYVLNEVGIYRIVLGMKDKLPRTFSVFCAMPEVERVTYTKGEDFTINGTAQNNRYDGYLEILLYLFILVAALAIADFGVYCYEQYQLR